MLGVCRQHSLTSVRHERPDCAGTAGAASFQCRLSDPLVSDIVQSVSTAPLSSSVYGCPGRPEAEWYWQLTHTDSAPRRFPVASSKLCQNCHKSETERGPERSCRINTQGSYIALEIIYIYLFTVLRFWRPCDFEIVSRSLKVV